MHLANNFPALYSLTEQFLDRLNNVFFSGNAAYDSEREVFYTFKPYPQSLKSTQIDDWAELQCKVLVPFINGDYYCFLHSKGLCFWSSMTPLKGLPETAMQPALPDGIHLCKGASHFYRQSWKNGVMQVCETIPQDESSTGIINLEVGQGAWARKRQIDKWLGEPVTWALASVACTLFVGLALITGYLSMQAQLSSLAEQQNNIEQKLGDKLAMQNELQSLIRAENQLREWQYSNGLLPPNLALLIEVVTDQVEWQATSILWQERSLTAEINATELDLARLVTDLEATGAFSDVSVRPGSRLNGWQIEVILNDF